MDSSEERLGELTGMERDSCCCCVDDLMVSLLELLLSRFFLASLALFFKSLISYDSLCFFGSSFFDLEPPPNRNIMI